MEAISNAGAAVGVLARDGVVLAAEKRITSKVREKGGGARSFFFNGVRGESAPPAWGGPGQGRRTRTQARARDRP